MCAADPSAQIPGQIRAGRSATLCARLGGSPRPDERSARRTVAPNRSASSRLVVELAAPPRVVSAPRQYVVVNWGDYMAKLEVSDEDSSTEVVRGDCLFRSDVCFVLNLAARMQARSFQYGRLRDETLALPERIAAGTLDAGLWLLGLADLAPASQMVQSDRSPGRVADERDRTATLRRRFVVDDPEWLYLGGVLDALDFAIGLEESFWWVPLPDVMRVGRRDGTSTAERWASA